MPKMVRSRKKKVLKNVYVVVNKYGTSGLVYANFLLAEKFQERQERKDPQSGPWSVQPIQVMGIPSETDMDLILDYLIRKNIVTKRTPRFEVTRKMMDYFSKGNYSLDFNPGKDMWVCRNKLTGKSYSDVMPSMAIQKMFRAGQVSKVPRRLQTA